MTPPSRDPTIESHFPNLVSGDSWYEIASPRDAQYNCHALAVGDTTRRWAPVRSSGEQEEDFFWPLQVSGSQVDDFFALYESLGYRQCEHGEPEKGFEKLALFVDDWGRVTHTAFRRDGEDVWVSKLGRSYDIKHNRVDAVGGHLYGWPDVYFSRPVPQPPPHPGHAAKHRPRAPRR